MIALSDEHRRALLATARVSLEAALHGLGARPAPVKPIVRQRAGAFVTLFARGTLRGCIGAIRGDVPLSRLVARLAVSTAFSDPRFPSVRPSELSYLELEISVLTEPRPAAVADVVVGRHGVIIERPPRRGLLLPQVAAEHRLDRDGFLAAVCRKAGLPDAAYLEPDARLKVFEADVFRERQHEAPRVSG